MEERIVLDKRSFEALAVDSRVRILKSLKERRKTLSEIAREQDMSVSGTKEHLSNLEGVGLIRKIDDGHKWKYYELTRKGKEIVGPKEVRVWILLSASVLALLFSAMMLSGIPMQDTAMRAPEAGAVLEDSGSKAAMDSLEYASPLMASAGNAPNDTNRSMAEKAAGEQISAESYGEQDVAVPLAILGISAISILACLGILVRNRLISSP